MSAYKRSDAWGDHWRYRKWVRLPDGRRVRIAGTPAINTKDAAEKAERAHVERTLNPPKPVVERRKMSDVFDRFLADYVAIANNKASEVASKKSAIERYLTPQIGKLYLDELRAPQVADLTAKLHKLEKVYGEGVIGSKTIKNILQTLRKCLRWAESMEWIDKVPAIHMPKIDETEIVFLEDAELSARRQSRPRPPSRCGSPQCCSVATRACDAASCARCAGPTSTR